VILLLQMETVQIATSFWGPYLRMLSVPNIGWLHHSGSEWAQSSPLLGRVFYRNEAFFRELKTMVDDRRARYSYMFNPTVFNEQALRVAFAIFRSRAHSLTVASPPGLHSFEQREAQRKRSVAPSYSDPVVIPFVDMANHKAYSSDSRALELAVAHTGEIMRIMLECAKPPCSHVQRGREVFHHYGDKHHGVFWVNYGLCETEAHTMDHQQAARTLLISSDQLGWGTDNVTECLGSLAKQLTAFKTKPLRSSSLAAAKEFLSSANCVLEATTRLLERNQQFQQTAVFREKGALAAAGAHLVRNEETLLRRAIESLKLEVCLHAISIKASDRDLDGHVFECSS